MRSADLTKLKPFITGVEDLHATHRNANPEHCRCTGRRDDKGRWLYLPDRVCARRYPRECRSMWVVAARLWFEQCNVSVAHLDDVVLVDVVNDLHAAVLLAARIDLDQLDILVQQAMRRPEPAATQA